MEKIREKLENEKFRDNRLEFLKRINFCEDLYNNILDKELVYKIVSQYKWLYDVWYNYFSVVNSPVDCGYNIFGCIFEDINKVMKKLEDLEND